MILQLVKSENFMRLTNYEIISIKESFHQVFYDGNIYLFGSRVDDSLKGGDIDLFIELNTTFAIKEMLDKIGEFKINLYNKIGELKIDVIISKNKTRLIEQEALNKGILL
jgi:predicted nucleotidyltransferase